MECNLDSAALDRGRLAVLSAHLANSSSGDVLTILEPAPVSAHEIARPPGNLGGLQMVVDGRTGKRYEIKVSDEGTVRSTDLKKIFTKFDPRFSKDNNRKRGQGA